MKADNLTIKLRVKLSWISAIKQRLAGINKSNPGINIENTVIKTPDLLPFESNFINLIKENTRKIANNRAAIINRMMNPIVECETCGCLLKKATAIKGPGVIRDITTYSSGFNGIGCTIGESEAIYHPYYCKLHAPKLPKPPKEKK